MNNLRKRIEKLESNSKGGNTALIFVPRHWSADQCAQATEHLLDELNLPESCKPWVVPDWDAAEAKIGFVGDLNNLFASIAAKGKRITDHPV